MKDFRLLSILAFVDFLSLGIILPVAPELIVHVTKLDPVDAAKVGGLLITSYAVMQFAYSLFVVQFSDRFGRKPFLAISLAGMCIGYLMLAFASSVLALFVARMTAGICGTTLPTIYATISDGTSKDERTKKFGIISGVGGLGMIIGPAVGSVTATFNLALPFVLSGVLTAAVLFLLLGKFNETEREQTTLATDRKPVRVLSSIRLVRSDPVVSSAFCLLFLVHFTLHALISAWPFYALEHLDWTSFEIGIAFATFGLSLGLTRIFLIPLLLPRLGRGGTVRFGFTCLTLGYLGISFAPGSIIFVFLPIVALGGVVNPVIQSTNNFRVDEKSYATFQGAMAAAYSIANIVAPIVMVYAFSSFALTLPTAPTLLAAALCAACTVALFSFQKTLRI